MEPIQLFISYSWDSDEHKEWVKKLADALEEIEEVHVTWDGYDLDSLVDKNHFMESGIYDANMILVVTTKIYKEKADQRIGGVGIETCLASAVHWSRMQREQKTGVIVIRREADSIPRYLESHICLDFQGDANYSRRINELIDIIRGVALVERPKKRRSLATRDGYEFTRVEDLIRINYPNRRAIVGESAGTDFSGGNRIKYELWETRSPAVGYFLALHANINITQTALHAAENFVKNRIVPVDVTVLRMRNARPEQGIISKSFEAKGLSARVHECTYKEYIWDFCIDEVLKAVDPPAEIENYTNQSLAFRDQLTGESTKNDSALDYFVAALQEPSGASAHLVVAPGGMGKTSLCLSVAKKLHFRADLRSSVILIQAEAIKKYLADKAGARPTIESIYDIYEIYAKYQAHGKIFERSTFDLAVVCGNLAIIIDGLDEISSLFQEKFDIGGFLESLKKLHDQLGSSNVLLTTRNNVVEDTHLDSLSIRTYELLGFDEESCRRYVSRRFYHYSNASSIVGRVMAQVAKMRMRDQEGRIVPFLADITATVAEDELNEGNGQGFEVEEDPTPFPSNNELTDHIVYSMLRREEIRHQIGISIEEVVDILGGLVADYGKRWPLEEMRERIQLLYEVRAQSICAKLQLNPLLIEKNGDVELRYSLLSSYFEVIFMLQAIVRRSVELESVRSLARLSLESEEARELRKFFARNTQKIKGALESLVPSLRDRALSAENSITEREHAKDAIASLLGIYCSFSDDSVDIATDKVLSIYGVGPSAGTATTLAGLFLRGDFPPFDFSSLIVTKSRFKSYRNFLSSRFDMNTKFMYSTFEGCMVSGVSHPDLVSSMLDSTCDLGDLREALAMSQVAKVDEQALIRSEAMRFLHSFFRGNRFVDNKKEFIKFSTKVQGLSLNRFDRLVAKGYVVLAKEKTVADFYAIAVDFKESVRKLLANGYVDGKMRKFMIDLRGA